MGLGMATGCHVKDEPRPAAATCEDDCSLDDLPETRPSEQSTSGSAGASGAGGEAGSSGVDVEGRLYWLDSQTFDPDTSRRFAEDSSVSMMLAKDRRLTSADALSGRFALDGVLGDRLSPVVASPNGSSLALPTISWADTLTNQDLQVPVVSAAALDAAFAVVTTPETRNDAAGQVVLRFTSEGSGDGVTGVRLQPPSGGKVIYDAGSTWTDLAVGSGRRGIALIQNLPVVGGGLQPLHVRFEDDSSVTEGLGLLVAAGMVSYFEVVVAQ